MPFTRAIIFLKDKNGTFKLRDDLKSFGFDEKRSQYYVQFKNGENVLHYNPANVDVASFVGQLEPPFRVLRKSDGRVFNNVLGVRLYQGQHNKAVRIIYESGSARNYTADYLIIEEHIDDFRSINVWEYLNEVAKYNVISTDDDNTLSLADKFAKMEFVTKNSLLEAYLNVDSYHKDNRRKSEPIFPFGCNRSQYKAVRAALENSLSVIQGPPGTGKTQTILNIMANLLLEGKTMQIVSNNNSAVENVQEKLKAEGLAFLCAQLGRASNKSLFIESQIGEYPDLSSWSLDNEISIRKEAVKLSKDLQELYEWQEELASLSESLEEYRLQFERFPQKFVSKRKIQLSVLQKFFYICSHSIDKKGSLSWLTKARLYFNRLPYHNDAYDEIQYLYFEGKIHEIETECEEYRERLKGIDQKNTRLRELSMSILKNYLYKTYGKSKSRDVFSIDEIYSKSRTFLCEYPVVLSTTFSATSNINPACKFDYLIMDEASQVDIAAGALALSCANNAVIVGDLKQLPNVVDEHTEEVVNAIFAKYQISEAYRYSTNSFLSSICKLYPNIPQTLLREHYRCNPLIIGFCSKQFYNGQLIPMRKEDAAYSPIRVIRTVKGNHARGNVNIRQIDSIIHEVLPALEEQFTDIGIIAPYNNQVSAIRNALNEYGKCYVAATVHKFQGRENDAIVLSTVDNQIKEFTDDPHLLNVAVSRAKKQFTLIVSAEEQPDSNIRDLIDYIEYYQGCREESHISSIFDLLYEEYTQELLEFYKTHKKVAAEDSENLAYWAIKDVISESRSAHLGILMHYPLKYLVSPSLNLTYEQRAYASRSWTHVDFLIYDKVSHKAKLAIEVDGTHFHRYGSDQKQRDAIKDSVLKAIGLPLLRLSTAGSQEKERIKEALSMV